MAVRRTPVRINSNSKKKKERKTHRDYLYVGYHNGAVVVRWQLLLVVVDALTERVVTGSDKI